MSGHAKVDAALEKLLASARHETLPTLDVSGVEARVFAEATRSEISSACVPARKRRWPAWVAVSAAAATSLFVASQAIRSHSTTTAGAPNRGELEQEEGLDGRTLKPEQLIVALDHDVTIKHPRTATWRLMANGKAKVVENNADRITIALETGLIQAEVVPRAKAESFAIEVDNTRVAVHGTLFSVERRGDTAEVVVREGRVIVGRSDQRGAMKGTLLTAPSRTRLDVGSVPPVTDEQTAYDNDGKRQPRVTGFGHPTTAARPTELDRTSPLGEKPSAEELERAWTSVAAEVATCFEEHTARSPSVRVSFKTHLSLTIGASGKVVDIGFNPPVPDPVRACTISRATQVETLPSLHGAMLSRPTVLTR